MNELTAARLTGLLAAYKSAKERLDELDDEIKALLKPHKDAIATVQKAHKARLDVLKKQTAGARNEADYFILIDSGLGAGRHTLPNGWWAQIDGPYSVFAVEGIAKFLASNPQPYLVEKIYLNQAVLDSIKSAGHELPPGVGVSESRKTKISVRGE